MLVLLILISSLADLGIDDKAQLSKKKSDISTYGTRPVYTEGVKRKLGDILQWNQLLFEDFESGVIPASWSVVDGNGDTETWQIYSTSAWRTNAMPADSGQYVVAYDDDAVGTNPATEEELILPAFRSAAYDSVSLIYSFGYQNYAGYDTVAVRVRTHDGASWGGWNNLVLYHTDLGSGLWDTLSIAPYLPADSFQIEFNWWDHHSSHCDWYIAVDNIRILAYIGGGGMHDIGVTNLNSPPAMMDINTPYPVISTFHNFGDSTMTFNAHAEITDTSGAPSYFNASTSPIALMPDSSIQINFGSWATTDFSKYRYMACTMTPDSNSHNDTLERIVGANVDFSVDSLISPPAGCTRHKPYNVIAAFSNKGSIDTTVDLHVTINHLGSPFFTVSSMGVRIKPDSSKIINFGHFAFPDTGTFDYTANVSSPIDMNPGNDTMAITGYASVWDEVTNIPVNLMDHAVVFDGNDVFVVGGYAGSMISRRSVYKYSPDSLGGGTWSLCDSMPIGLCMFDACVLGDTIYVPGGYSYSLGVIVDTLFKYSISGNNWVSGPGTGENAWFYMCEAANGKVYKIGGFDNGSSTLFNSTWEYDPSTGSWTSRASMPMATEYSASWVRNDSIYLAGGADPNMIIYHHQTQIYDAVNNTWTMDSTYFAYLPSPRFGPGGTIYRDTAFVMCGSPGYVTNTVFSYAFDGPNTWNVFPSTIYSIFRTKGLAIDGIGYGINGVYLFGGDIGGFNPIPFVQAKITYNTGIEENHEEAEAELLSIPRSISFNKISFSYIGNKAADIIVRDVAGRVVCEYINVEPGSTLNFGGGNSSGIYFISVKGTTESNKTILIR
jgi:hypothetical protein